MRKGELQQMDAPQTLYDAPANLFVASFIGSPAMNVVEAELARANGSYTVRVGEQELPVPADAAARRPALAGYVGRRVALGIRPEQLEDAALDGRGDGARLRGKVLLTEALGAEILAHVEVHAKPVVTDAVVESAVEDMREAEIAADLLGGDRTTLVGRLDAASRVRPDDVAELAVDTRKLHFFDLETGASIRA
jgi:multiple sugar transport system ATP-binding protein